MHERGWGWMIVLIAHSCRYFDYLDSEIALWTPLHFRLPKHEGETWWMELAAWSAISVPSAHF